MTAQTWASWRGHSTMVRAADLKMWDEARPVGWFSFFTALGARDVGNGWVEITWDVADCPGTPFTMFMADEPVEVRR